MPFAVHAQVQAAVHAADADQAHGQADELQDACRGHKKKQLLSFLVLSDAKDVLTPHNITQYPTIPHIKTTLLPSHYLYIHDFHLYWI